MAKILAAYFSASGVTARVAKTLADAAGAELYEIKPKTAYTEEDLDWRSPYSRSSKEMKGNLPYPELADQVIEMILLGKRSFRSALPLHRVWEKAEIF